jgi:hypothetical protein
VFGWLLPSLEQSHIYETARAASVGPSNWPTDYLCYPIKAFNCPSEPNPAGPNGPGMSKFNQPSIGGDSRPWGFGNYAANYFIFGNPPAGDTEGSNRFTSFPDGTSNTVMYAERYGGCTSTGSINSVYTTLWGDSTSYWRPVFCINNLQRTPSGTGYPACSMFQIQPNWLTACDATVPQTMHTAMQVCMVDGSVRGLSRGMSATTWHAICDPQDGNAPGDW